MPLLCKRFSADTPVDVGDSFWAVDLWIAPPLSSDVPLNQWTKNMKITETHALLLIEMDGSTGIQTCRPIAEISTGGHRQCVVFEITGCGDSQRGA